MEVKHSSKTLAYIRHYERSHQRIAREPPNKRELVTAWQLVWATQSTTTSLIQRKREDSQMSVQHERHRAYFYRQKLESHVIIKIIIIIFKLPSSLSSRTQPWLFPGRRRKTSMKFDYNITFDPVQNIFIFWSAVQLLKDWIFLLIMLWFGVFTLLDFRCFYRTTNGQALASSFSVNTWNTQK